MLPISAISDKYKAKSINFWITCFCKRLIYSTVFKWALAEPPRIISIFRPHDTGDIIHKFWISKASTERHKGDRSAGRRLKIASMAKQQCDGRSCMVSCALLYSIFNNCDKRGEIECIQAMHWCHRPCQDYLLGWQNKRMGHKRSCHKVGMVG